MEKNKPIPGMAFKDENSIYLEEPIFL